MEFFFLIRINIFEFLYKPEVIRGIISRKVSTSNKHEKPKKIIWELERSCENARKLSGKWIASIFQNFRLHLDIFTHWFWNVMEKGRRCCKAKYYSDFFLNSCIMGNCNSIAYYCSTLALKTGWRLCWVWTFSRPSA